VCWCSYNKRLCARTQSIDLLSTKLLRVLLMLCISDEICCLLRLQSISICSHGLCQGIAHATAAAGAAAAAVICPHVNAHKPIIRGCPSPHCHVHSFILRRRLAQHFVNDAWAMVSTAPFYSIKVGSRRRSGGGDVVWYRWWWWWWWCGGGEQKGPRISQTEAVPDEEGRHSATKSCRCS
jgi:hypothetical protein